jgi:hypothetical protein
MTINAVKTLLLSHISRNITQCYISGIKTSFQFWLCQCKALTELEGIKERFRK